MKENRGFVLRCVDLNRSGRLLTFVFMACLCTFVFAGPKWEFKEDQWMQLSFLGQVHARYTDGAVDEDDVYLRRGRIILSGQIRDGIRFFMETDNDNLGRSGVQGVSTDIQDAFVDFRLQKSEGHEVWLKAGLVLLPFCFENRSSAASLLGIDYNAESVMLTNSFVWRDYGFELSGTCGDRFDYRLSICDGAEEGGNKHPDAGARLTGHFVYTLWGKVSSGWFYSQNRLGSHEYVCLGVGYDTQDKANLNPTDPALEAIDNTAYVVDLQSSFKIGESHLLLNASWFDWDNVRFDGTTAFVEMGWLSGRFMVTLKGFMEDPCEGDSTEDITVGLHGFIKQHNARLGLEYRDGDSPTDILLGLQFLL